MSKRLSESPFHSEFSLCEVTSALRNFLGSGKMYEETKGSVSNKTELEKQTIYEQGA